MAVTVEKMRSNIERQVETGAANTALTVTMINPDRPFRLTTVTISYSAAPTQAGTTVTLDSGAGAGYDATLSTGTANARYTVYVPTTDLMLGDDDVIVVAAPAGGVGITASVAIYIETL